MPFATAEKDFHREDSVLTIFFFLTSICILLMTLIILVHSHSNSEVSVEKRYLDEEMPWYLFANSMDEP